MEENQLIESLRQASLNAAKKLADNFFPDKKADDRTLSKQASVEIEKIVENDFRELLLGQFPDLKILGEEFGDKGKEQQYSVVVDPLDGTSNFANGNPFFAFTAALLKNNEPVWGAVLAPKLGLEWFGHAGFGAFCNDKAITVSRINHPDRSYILWCEGGCIFKKRTLEIYDAIYPRVTDLRKLGSASIEGCFVAMGKAEGYISTNLSPWDTAAAVIITREAGGNVTDYSGDPWKLSTEDVIFSNGLIHENLLSLVKGK